MDVIQEVGSYAGFAAVVGLAVLAALFFSQARDLRRLREWAGRAPERAAEQAAAIEAALGQPPQAVSEGTGDEPAVPAPTGAVRPIPSRKPATAAAAGAEPATAVQAPETKDGAAKPPASAPVPATAAANAGQGAPGKPAGAPAAGGKPGDAPGAKQPDAGGKPPTAARPAPATPAAGPAATPPKPGAPPAVPGKPAAPGGPAAPATPGPGAPATPAAGKPPVPAVPRTPPPPARPGVPPRPAPVGRTPAPAAPQSTAVLPPSARLRGGQRDRDRLEPRYIALIVAGLIVLGGGLAFGVSQLGGDDGGAETAEGPRADQQQPPAGPLNRSLVTVSVLNGTNVPGLAAQIGDEVESKGFQRGNVANAIDQQRPTSAVLYAEGAERPARVVARSLGISAVEPVDPDSQALAGNASVVVVVGADQTQ